MVRKKRRCLIVEREDRRQSGRLLVFWASGVLHLVITLFPGERECGIVLKNLSSFTLRPHVTKDRSFSARLVANDLSSFQLYVYFQSRNVKESIENRGDVVCQRQTNPPTRGRLETGSMREVVGDVWQEEKHSRRPVNEWPYPVTRASLPRRQFRRERKVVCPSVSRICRRASIF